MAKFGAVIVGRSAEICGPSDQALNLLALSHHAAGPVYPRCVFSTSEDVRQLTIVWVRGRLKTGLASAKASMTTFGRRVSARYGSFLAPPNGYVGDRQKSS